MENLMRRTGKSVIKSVHNDSGINGEAHHYNILGVRHTTLKFFNMACAGVCECDRSCFPSRPDLSSKSPISSLSTTGCKTSNLPSTKQCNTRCFTLQDRGTG